MSTVEAVPSTFEQVAGLDWTQLLRQARHGKKPDKKSAAIQKLRQLGRFIRVSTIIVESGEPPQVCWGAEVSLRRTGEVVLESSDLPMVRGKKSADRMKLLDRLHALGL